MSSSLSRHRRHRHRHGRVWSLEEERTIILPEWRIFFNVVFFFFMVGCSLVLVGRRHHHHHHRHRQRRHHRHSTSAALPGYCSVRLNKTKMFTVYAVRAGMCVHRSTVVSSSSGRPLPNDILFLNNKKVTYTYLTPHFMVYSIQYSIHGADE